MQNKNVLIDNNNDIMALFDQINEDIKSAMKARDKVRLETLRNIRKYFWKQKPLLEPTTHWLMLMH